ncbi:TPA: AAA family ATPase, partial [Streptococcus equi subsp. zooepidemicus]|nr:AAA family ATPase [Streptococcus equi subsp. zooepidemicus]
VRKEVKLLDSEGTPASGGQAVGFALMLRLNEAKNKPVILIDEPESSLDNAYIKTELNKALKNLSENSMVVVITHNSTLGALLEPDYLIVTSKSDNGEYSIMSGEFSSSKIRDAEGIEEKSYNKFVEAMESGIESYKKKGVIYGSLNN